MMITRKSPFSNKVNTRDIDVSEEEIRAWESGVPIQHAMRDLSADDREFLMTGITPEEWDAAFGHEEEL